MPRPDHEAPPFAAALRGYDRDQVDDHLAALHARLREADARALAAEQRSLEEAQHGVGGTGDESTDAVPLVPAARAVQGLPQRLADAVREAVQAAERAGASLLAEVEQERSVATESARAALEQAQRDAVQLVAEARAEAERLVRDAAVQAEQVSRQELERDRARRAALEEELTTLRQRADQEQARRDHTIRQIEVLRRSLEAAARPDTGSLSNALFGSDPSAADVEQRGSRRVAEPDEADTDVLGGAPQQARAAAERSQGASPEAAPEAQELSRQPVEPYGDPYGDRTQVLRLPE